MNEEGMNESIHRMNHRKRKHKESTKHNNAPDRGEARGRHTRTADDNIPYNSMLND